MVSDNVVSRTQVDGIGIKDFDPSDPGNPLPDRTTVRGNIVRHAGADGVHVDAGIAGTVLERNRAFAAGDDGIQVDSPASVLTGNRASRNHDLGIEAVAGRHRRRRQPGPPQRQPGPVPRGRLRLSTPSNAASAARAAGGREIVTSSPNGHTEPAHREGRPVAGDPPAPGRVPSALGGSRTWG